MVVEIDRDGVGHRSVGGDLRHLLVFCLPAAQGVYQCRGVFWVFAGDMYWVGGRRGGYWVVGQLAVCEEDICGD